MNDELSLQKKLDSLRWRHRELDENLDRLASSNVLNPFQIADLKKQRLAIRDQIAMLEQMLYPDIIA